MSALRQMAANVLVGSDAVNDKEKIRELNEYLRKAESIVLSSSLSPRTARAVQALRQGKKPVGYSKQQLAAYKAWMSMGRY